MCKFLSLYTRYESFKTRNKFCTQKYRSVFVPDSNIFTKMESQKIKNNKKITEIYIIIFRHADLEWQVRRELYCEAVTF